MGLTFSWNHLLHTKRSLYLLSYKHAVYPRFRVATALLVQIPSFKNMNPCRSVTIKRFFGESAWFPLLHLECYVTADVFTHEAAAAAADAAACWLPIYNTRSNDRQFVLTESWTKYMNSVDDTNHYKSSRDISVKRQETAY